uniref:Uncharacterized protein n=1 Tax=Anguilla anguilla TaxID=7936 RepID=A0A0E9Q9B3_ANGAN
MIHTTKKASDSRWTALTAIIRKDKVLGTK